MWLYLAHDSNPASSNHRTRVSETRWPTTITSVNTNSVPSVLHPQRQEQWNTNEVIVTPATTNELPRTVDTRQAQLAVQQREAQERQRQQAEAARLQQERARQEQKARGQDVIIPLDQEKIIYVGGIPLRVKIHENDVTSFDVWINGSHYREVPKQKGITQSGTDETLIYNNGPARLFYVWEISGTLNSCRLRIRED